MASNETGPWHPAGVKQTAGPIYLGIADAMADDIAAGRLAPGQRLPPHRVLAEALAVDLTTVTRAYNEARRRGLIDAAPGRGTFVRAASRGTPTRSAAVDISMNLPPAPDDAHLRERLSDTLAELGRRPDFHALLSYRPSAGDEEDRAAGAAWLRLRELDATPQRIVVCPGAQVALMVLLTTLLKPGDTLLTECLTYPGIRALAAHVGVRLQGLAMDGEGLTPDAFEAACKDGKPKALYCVPTIHNPTTATLSAARRAQVAAIARRHGILIFEDDAYGFLPSQAPKPLAAYAPELTYHVATLSKCLTPALRVAYVLTPEAGDAVRLAAGQRATALMTAPILAATASSWIGSGAAQAIVAAVRRESMARQQIACDILPADLVAAHAQGHHLWLSLPPAWTGGEFAGHARRHGLAAVAGEAFAVEMGGAGAAVRLSLGRRRRATTCARP
ncbi:aminotransferase-like domain-containing protein [Oleomonas cavernae]|uniref:aminotransferase-like domain-containing protein n=1 Tax=Oleomonas cavernae TaxID=2320859 RepID=UPI001F3F180D|nr:PLP-dependent aminotransferase family protein [Oleomonas cavernae]